MARPKKKGLDYFPLDADFFSDTKIKILKARYGADGVTIYLYLLCEIYKNGYYITMNDDFQYIMSDDLNMSIEKVKQVLKFLLERSLFDHKLFQSDTILTSAGIQKRYQNAVKERAKKTPIEIEGFWLLKKEETEPFIKGTHFEDISKNQRSFSGKNENKSQEQSLKESKGKNYIYYKNPELEKVFLCYIQMRNNKEGNPLMPEQIQILKEELERIAETDEKRIEIAKKALASGWKSFYPLKEKRQSENPKKATSNKFHNFKQRDYNYDALEQAFIKKINGI